MDSLARDVGADLGGHLLGDVPMARVKMNAKHEYEFIANFKVLQNVFKAKKIDKVRRPSFTPSSQSNLNTAQITAYTSREARQVQDAVRVTPPLPPPPHTFSFFSNLAKSTCRFHHKGTTSNFCNG